MSFAAISQWTMKCLVKYRDFIIYTIQSSYISKYETILDDIVFN